MFDYERKRMRRWWHRFTGGCLLYHQWVDEEPVPLDGGGTRTRSVCQKCGKRLVTIRIPGEFWQAYEEKHD
jgi:hypothetical protein